MKPNTLVDLVSRAYRGGHRCLECKGSAVTRGPTKAKPLPPSKLPKGWQDDLRDAIGQVLFRHNLNMSEVFGKSWTHQLVQDSARVPTFKKMANNLSAYNIKVSEVVDAWEAIMAENHGYV